MYDFTSTLQDLDGGVFLEKLSAGVAQAAQGTVHHGEKGRKGKVIIELTFDRIAESSQVQIAHKITTTIPTPKGKVSEEDTTTTPMYVGKKGALTIAPDNQMKMFEEKA